jgi:AcrR family transcriptional regulator
MTVPDSTRPMRADARRNRARVLDAALAAFAREGLSVPVQEIARRAGVGTGTVSRHFPTKESLFAAVLQSRVDFLVGQAEELSSSSDPAAAFFRFFELVIEEGAANLGLAEAMSGAGLDLSGFSAEIFSAERTLLRRAQDAGAVRPDLDHADVKAMITGCLTRADDPAARARLIAVMCAGMLSAPT